MAKENEASAAKDKAMELAEDARETEWKLPSFTAEMFRGKFRWDLLNPYPLQSDEDKQIGDAFLVRLKDVLEKHINPNEIDRTNVYPQEALDALAEIGAFGISIPKEYGGLGFSKVNYCRALHLLGSYCAATTTWISAHQSIGAPQPLKLFGTEAQKKKFLPRLAAGEVSAFALTEPDVGSDPAKMMTTAVPTEDGNHYLINGTKLWITNGPDADIMVVMANIPGKIVNGKEKLQITTFIVEGNMPGFEVERHCTFMGLHGISNGLLKFTDIKVPKENMIGNPGQGLKIALTTLNTGRLGMPASSAGGAKAMMVELERWINERIQWGVPIGRHQAIAKYAANIAANTLAMDSIVWLTSHWADLGNADIRLEAAAAKYFCTETSYQMLDDFLQVRGGRGYETASSLHNRGERPVAAERWLRDSRIGRIFEGSTQVMYLIMSREAMDTHFKLIMPLMNRHPKEKRSKLQLLTAATKFYSTWYPMLYLPSAQDYSVKHLSSTNQAFLPWIEKRTRKLARKLFHTMAKYKEKLEFEQVILANFVDIGVDLFAMASTLAFAEVKMAENPEDQTPQELAELFCRNAQQRIETNFAAVGKNHNRLFNTVTNTLMAGKLEWMYNDIYEGLAPEWHEAAQEVASEPAPQTEPAASADQEHVPTPR